MEFIKRFHIRIRIAVFVIIISVTGIIMFTRGTKTLEAVPESHESGVGEMEPVLIHPVVAEFNEFMDLELNSSRTVGAAYTVVMGDRVVHTGTYGEKRVGSGERVDGHTLFRLASVSKGFAGALACILEEEEVFSLDDRVVDLYPGFKLKDSLNTADLTLRHLLSHTSGLVPYAFDNLVEAGEELASIVERLPEVEISGPPRRVIRLPECSFQYA